MNFKHFYYQMTEGILSSYNIDELKTISQEDWEGDEGDPIIGRIKNEIGDISYEQFKEMLRKEDIEQTAVNNSEEMNFNDPMKSVDPGDSANGGGGGETTPYIS